jgi:mannose-6-phosphate isomerase-like protein (cupin superfamily)
MVTEHRTYSQVVSRPDPLLLDHLGPTIEVLTRDDVPATMPGLARGTIVPGGFVPMHSHSDPETFYVLDGELQGLTYPTPDAARWVPVRAGQIFHVPPGARHALRNVSDAPSSTLIISSLDMIAFFEQTGRPLTSVDEPRPAPAPETIDRMLRVAREHGHWLAPPELNAEVGLRPAGPPDG